NFFDPNFNQVDWPAMREKYQPLADRSQSPGEEAAVINQMLRELQVSHTQFFTPQEPAYYQLLGIFLPRNDRLQEKVKQILPSGQPTYTGIGIFTLQHQGQTFISAILDGSPGAKAGLLVGDRIFKCRW
ncbi:MAG: peptidase S41, partial [Chloroflexaceae bacterium]|nr:peptidase S41 [Chloroflexaceae bacterium]